MGTTPPGWDTCSYWGPLLPPAVPVSALLWSLWRCKRVRLPTSGRCSRGRCCERVRRGDTGLQQNETPFFGRGCGELRAPQVVLNTCNVPERLSGAFLKSTGHGHRQCLLGTLATGGGQRGCLGGKVGPGQRGEFRPSSENVGVTGRLGRGPMCRQCAEVR